MEQKLLKFIHHHQLFEKGHRLLLTVSGGIDSMVMLHLLHKFQFNISVAHCNFGLRGEESDADTSFVEDTCGKLQIPCFIRHFDTNAFATENGISIQMAARELRYMWFHELKKNHGFDFIITAHHADDQLETILLNLVRGKGPSSWSGIPIKNGEIIRPMLSLFKEEINLYAREHAIKSREDSSNLKADYDRNFIRHRITPLLKELNPSVVNTFSQNAEMAASRELMIKDYLRIIKTGLIKEESDSLKIDLIELLKLPAPASILFELIAEKGFTHDQCNSITSNEIRTSGKQYFSENFRAIIDRNVLVIKINSIKNIEPATFSLNEKTVIIGTGELTIQCLNKTEIDYKNIPENEACIDLEMLASTLQIRGIENGDFFMPLGMEHKKLLSDFFIDKKMSIFEKEQTAVLLNNNDIIWVIGHRIDHRYRITEKTNKVLHLIWTPK